MRIQLNSETGCDATCPFNYYYNFQMKFETLSVRAAAAAAVVCQLFDSKNIFAVQRFRPCLIHTATPFDFGKHYCRIDRCATSGTYRLRDVPNASQPN